jgi:glycosyltransferase involved in cell wall biosynthesis
MMRSMEETPLVQEMEQDRVVTQVEKAKGEGLKVAYIMSRFPKLTETFVLYEMIAVQREGVRVETYPLLREKAEVVHPDAVPFVESAHFQPFLSLPILRAQWYFLRRKPGEYLRTLWTLLRANWGSFRFFTGVLGIFPKSVLFAYQMMADNIDHVHAHFASHPAAAAFIIHRLVGIPYSFTAHGSDLHRDRHMLREKVAEAAFVVAISNYNRELIVEECQGQFRDKVIVIHCGVDTNVFVDQSAGRSPGTGKQPFTIVCVGTLHEVKGQAYLIEACANLNNKGFDFVCHFVGDGADRSTLMALAEQAGISAKVRFHGQQTRERVAQIIQGADALVAPSVPTSDGRREGIPVVLIEAMSSGVPVIASRLSGIPELVVNEQTGLLTTPRDADSITNALERYYHDPALRRQLGQAGRQKVAEEFDLYKNAAKLVQHIAAEI